MNAANQFVELVRETLVDVETQVRPLANTFMRFCAVCMEIMPHYREETYCQCMVCETKTYRRQRTESGQALLEIVFWIAIVALVLLGLLSNVPW